MGDFSNTYCKFVEQLCPNFEGFRGVWAPLGRFWSLLWKNAISTDVDEEFQRTLLRAIVDSSAWTVHDAPLFYNLFTGPP